MKVTLVIYLQQAEGMVRYHKLPMPSAVTSAAKNISSTVMALKYNFKLFPLTKPFQPITTHGFVPAFPFLSSFLPETGRFILRTEVSYSSINTLSDLDFLTHRHTLTIHQH